MSDYAVEKPTKFHAHAMRPIINLIRQKRPASFGKSIFQKKAQADIGFVNRPLEETEGGILQLVKKFFTEHPEDLEKVRQRTGLTSTQDVLTYFEQNPTAAADLFEYASHKPQTSTPELYRQLSMSLRRSPTGGPRAGRHLQATGTGSAVFDAATDVLTGATPVGKALQYLRYTPIGHVLGAKLNPYDAGADPKTQSVLQQIQLSQQLEGLQQRAQDSNLPAEQRQQLAEQADSVRQQLQETVKTAPPMSPEEQQSIARNLINAGAYNLSNVTTSMISPTLARLAPGYRLLSEAMGGRQKAEALQRGDSAPEFSRWTLAGGEAARDLAQVEAARKAWAARGATTLGARASALPGVVGRAVSAPAALGAQAVGSLFEGIHSATSDNELAAIEEEQAQQLARSMMGRGTFGKDLFLGGLQGAASFSTADKRPFRAAVSSAMQSHASPMVQQRAQEIIDATRFEEAEGNFQQQLGQAYPMLPPEQLARMAREAAERQFIHSRRPMSAALPAYATVDTEEGPQHISLVDLKPHLATLPQEQQQAFIRAYELAPQAALESLIDPEGDGRIRTEYLTGGTPAPRMTTVDGRLASVSHYSPGQEQEGITQELQQESARRGAHEAELAGIQQQTQTRLEQQQRRQQQEELDWQVSRTNKEVEHRNRIAALRKPQEDNLAWRREQDKRWQFPATSSPAAPTNAAPPEAGNVLAKDWRSPKPATAPPVTPPAQDTSLAQHIPRWR